MTWLASPPMGATRMANSAVMASGAGPVLSGAGVTAVTSGSRQNWMAR